MRIIIIGAVAAGTSAAAKARRNDETAEIVLYDKDSEYSCAMKSQFRKTGNQMSGTGNHQLLCASLLAHVFI